MRSIQPGSDRQPTPGEEPEIRFYRPGDERGILALMGRAFERWPRPDLPGTAMDYLRWKLHNHPEAPRYHIVAEAEGKIVGFRLFLIQKAKVGQALLVTRQETDTAVDPDYQGRGLMTSMSYPTPEALRRDFDLYFALSGNQPAFRSMRKRERTQRFSARVDVLVCPRPTSSVPRASNCRVVQAFDERVNELWRESASSFDFAVERTSEAMNRRYADKRAGPYTITIVEENGLLLGYVVTATSKTRIRIADVLFPPDRPDIGEQLLSWTVQFRVSDARPIECWMPQLHPYRDLLERAGFTDKRREFEVFFLAQRAPESSLAVLASDVAVVHLMAGDTDLV